MDLTFEQVDTEATPLGLLTLHRYAAPGGAEGYEVRLDGAFLMATHGAHGEVRMARLGWARLAAPRAHLRVLVGGLGAGHTLRAALALPGATAVDVVEVGAKVVDWNRRFFARDGPSPVDDPRARVHVGDLAAILRASAARWDLLLLDVDNGPGWLAAPGNAWLYTPDGLLACARALRPGGALAVWSPAPNAAFLAALCETFAEVDEAVTRTPGERGEDVVYVATSPRGRRGRRSTR